VLTPVFVAQAIIGVALAAANFWFWWLVVKRWHDRFRARCERKYGVTITMGSRGHWQVSGPQSWIKRFAIEWLQLAYFMGAFVVWAIGLLLGVGVLALIERAGR
jgi:hypothetical protein